MTTRSLRPDRARPVAAPRAARLRAVRFARGAAAALLALAGTACVATRQDVQLLRNDIAAAQAQSARADSARAREQARLLAALGVVQDTLRAISARDARFAGDVREALRTINEQLLTVQELTGQSQRRIQELRASLEARATEAAQQAAPPSATPAEAEPAAEPARGGRSGAAGGSTGRGSTTPAPSSGTRPSAPATPRSGATRPAGDAADADSAAEPAGPGPNELHQLALDQFRRGSWGAARTGFSDLLRRYPTADVAPEAQFYVAETWAAEKSTARADSAYAAVVTRYPQSSRAPTALYKRARLKIAAGQRTQARPLFEEVVRRWPRSDEAVLSREALRTLDRGAADR